MARGERPATNTSSGTVCGGSRFTLAETATDGAKLLPPVAPMALGVAPMALGVAPMALGVAPIGAGRGANGAVRGANCWVVAPIAWWRQLLGGGANWAWRQLLGGGAKKLRFQNFS